MNASTRRNLAAFVAPIFFALVPVAQDHAGPAEYKAGQVWQLSGGDETVTLLKVEDLHKIGRVVHVRVDKVSEGCQGIHLTTSIDHIVLTEKMMRKSPATLLQEKTDLPDSCFDAYRVWQKQKKVYVREDQTVWDV